MKTIWKHEISGDRANALANALHEAFPNVWFVCDGVAVLATLGDPAWGAFLDAFVKEWEREN